MWLQGEIYQPSPPPKEMKFRVSQVVPDISYYISSQFSLSCSMFPQQAYKSHPNDTKEKTVGSQRNIALQPSPKLGLRWDVPILPYAYKGLSVFCGNYRSVDLEITYTTIQYSVSCPIISSTRKSTSSCGGGWCSSSPCPVWEYSYGSLHCCREVTSG